MRNRKNREKKGAGYSRKAVNKWREKDGKKKEVEDQMKPLWLQSPNSIQEEEALRVHLETAISTYILPLPFTSG